MSLKNNVIKYSKSVITDEDLIALNYEAFVKETDNLEKVLMREPACKQDAQLQGMACRGTLTLELEEV